MNRASGGQWRAAAKKNAKASMKELQQTGQGSNARPLKVGMIGLGGFGAHRRRTMRQTGLFRIVAGCDRNGAVLAEACAQEGAIECPTFESLLAVDGLEGVVISTGADSHAALAVAAMQRGLHVFVEKPLCCTVGEVEQLREVQSATQRVVGVGHHHPADDRSSRLARQHMDEGKLGKIVAYEANESHSGGLQIRPGDWRGRGDTNPGGMLFHCGVHALHQVCDLFGPVTAVSAMMRYDAHPATATADAATVLLRHESGLLGTLNCYHVTAYCHVLRLFGTGGNLYIDKHAGRAWYQKALYGPVEPQQEMAAPPAPARNSNLVSWYRAIRGEGAARPGLEDGVRAVLPVFAAEVAARERRQVMIEELSQADAVA